MGKNKLERFAELETLQRVFQPGMSYPPADFALKGKWHEEVFHNHRPIVLELGCGRGEYTVEMARQFPDKNFIGIDKKGSRLWRGAKTGHEEQLLNTAFLRIQIQHLSYFFEKDEISELWITFPDPQPGQSRENARLTSPRFLEMYRRLLPPGGVVHLKTDSRPLFEYSLEKAREAGATIPEQTTHLYASAPASEVMQIKTTYEKRFLKEGKEICYMALHFDAAV